jgi:hypothetical protein
MPRVRLDLDERTFDALAKAAVSELRPIAWQAEIILRQHLQTESNSRESLPTAATNKSASGRGSKEARLAVS